jgi:non-ribosomal peptide synthetase component F
LPELPVQYADYAAWQRQWLQGDVLEEEMAYWKQQLANAPTQIDLPTDRPRPPVQSFRGARHNFELATELAEEIKAFSQMQGATLYMTLLAAFKALLSSYTGTDDIVVGSPTAGRTRVETEGMIGFFINTLVLRTSLADSPSFAQLLRRVREVILGATAHQEVQFDRIVEMLRPPRDRSRNPVFQVNFRVQTAPPAPIDLPGLTAQPVDVLEFATSKFDLALDLTDVDGLHGYIEYNTDLFDPETIVRVRQDFEETLRAVLRQPTTPLASLNLPRTPLNRVVTKDWPGRDRLTR